MSRFTDDLVQVALGEWDFFGRPQRNLDGTTVDGKKEYQDGAYQRIGDYWKIIGGAFANLTGKDRGTPWSAAFVSFCMEKAGAGPRFPNSAGHATYINAAIRAARDGDPAAGFVAHSKSDYIVKPGDLVGYWRGERKITLQNALSIGWYPSHTDIVVEVGDRFMYVIGGNVGHSVTRKQLRASVEGKLTDTRFPWFVVIENRI